MNLDPRDDRDPRSSEAALEVPSGATDTESSGPPPDDTHLRYLLTAYLFGDISPEGRTEVEQHLESCDVCRRELDRLRATQACVAELFGADAELAQDEISAARADAYEFEERRRQRILEAARERRSWFPSWPRRETSTLSRSPRRASWTRTVASSSRRVAALIVVGVLLVLVAISQMQKASDGVKSEATLSWRAEPKSARRSPDSEMNDFASDTRVPADGSAGEPEASEYAPPTYDPSRKRAMERKPQILNAQAKKPISMKQIDPIPAERPKANAALGDDAIQDLAGLSRSPEKNAELPRSPAPSGRFDRRAKAPNEALSAGPGAATGAPPPMEPGARGGLVDGPMAEAASEDDGDEPETVTFYGSDFDPGDRLRDRAGRRSNTRSEGLEDGRGGKGALAQQPRGEDERFSGGTGLIVQEVTDAEVATVDTGVVPPPGVTVRSNDPDDATKFGFVDSTIGYQDHSASSVDSVDDGIEESFNDSLKFDPGVAEWRFSEPRELESPNKHGGVALEQSKKKEERQQTRAAEEQRDNSFEVTLGIGLGQEVDSADDIVLIAGGYQTPTPLFTPSLKLTEIMNDRGLAAETAANGAVDHKAGAVEESESSRGYFGYSYFQDEPVEGEKRAGDQDSLGVDLYLKDSLARGADPQSELRGGQGSAHGYRNARGAVVPGSEDAERRQSESTTLGKIEFPRGEGSNTIELKRFAQILTEATGTTITFPSSPTDPNFNDAPMIEISEDLNPITLEDGLRVLRQNGFSATPSEHGGLELRRVDGLTPAELERQRALESTELRLRALDHYRERESNISSADVTARRLTVPAPAIGDEGLGREGFRAVYGVNPFVDAQRDAFSTFSMDVDTASYTLAMNTIDRGRLPDPSTVRVEEFVNAWPLTPPPSTDEDFSVVSEGAPAPFGEGVDLLRVAVRARDLADGERRAVQLTLAVDTSGSMLLDDRLSLFGQALDQLLSALEPTDQVALVGYGAEAFVALPHTPVHEADRIRAAFRNLAPAGETNVEAGLALAYRLSEEVFEPRALNRVLLISDGVATAGERDAESVLDLVRGYAARGVFLSVIGCGEERYDDRFLETVANGGNGNYLYLDSVETARRFFVDELSSTLQVLAIDAKIQVEFDPDVVSHYRLLGYENRDIADRDFRNDQIDAAEVGPGTTVNALFEIRRRPGRAGDLGTVRVRYRSALTDRIEELAFPLVPGVLAPSFSETSADFQLLACVAEFAELLRESYWSRDGSFRALVSRLDRLAPSARAAPEWSALRARAEAAAQLYIDSRISSSQKNGG